MPGAFVRAADNYEQVCTWYSTAERRTLSMVNRKQSSADTNSQCHCQTTSITTLTSTVVMTMTATTTTPVQQVI